jgi:hypothetical protein
MSQNAMRITAMVLVGLLVLGAGASALAQLG